MARRSREPGRHPLLLPDDILPTIDALNGMLRDKALASSQRSRALRLSDALFDATGHLIVYGSLSPGGSNHARLAHLDGTWSPGVVTGDLIPHGWGASLGYPAMQWRSDGPRVPAWLLRAPGLAAEGEWEALDQFEGEEYCRILAPFLSLHGEIVAVGYLYEALSPKLDEPGDCSRAS